MRRPFLSLTSHKIRFPKTDYMYQHLPSNMVTNPSAKALP